MKVDTSLWSDDAKEKFINGWEDAGGYVDDFESDSPWSCPWYYDPVINVNARKPYDMGREYWRQKCREVEDTLREEEAYGDDEY